MNLLSFSRTLLIGAFYFLLGNMQPKYRQRLNSIKLLALVKSDVLNEHEMNKILEVLITGLKKLEEVMCTSINNFNSY